MEVEKLEVTGIESAEKCESIPQLGESSVSVGGDGDETVSPVGDPVAAEGGREDGVSVNYAPELSVEAAGEMVDKTVAVAEEGGREMIDAQVGESFLEVKDDEGGKRVDDAEGEPVLVSAESLVDNKDDELFLDPKLKMDAAEEELELGTHITESESQIVVRGNEIPLNPQLERTIEKGFNPETDPKMEPLSELQTDASWGELNVVMEGMEAWKNESERELGDEQNVDAVGGVDSELVETSTLENIANAGEGDQVNEDKVDVGVNDSEVATAGKPIVVEEEKVDSRITEEIPTTEVKGHGDMMTGVEQVHDSIDGMEYFGGDDVCDQTEDKERAAEESSMVGIKMANDESLGLEGLTDAKLDEPLNVSDYNEGVLVKEEHSAGDLKPDTEAGAEIEPTSRAAVEENRSMDDEVDTETGTNFDVADKPSDVDCKLETEDTMSDVDEPCQDIYDSPSALQEDDDEVMVAEEEAGTQDTEIETETDMTESGKSSVGKRKRGKLSKSSSISKTTGKASRKTVGDDVCFICFDGGELVLCDRRGCPKAYHPSCVNRDEAFFKSKGRWNCGWHLCSNCEKNAARYMCYTCTFSLCKSCTKDLAFFCVRGNKGFCEACKRTVMLIENNEKQNENTQVDFDDKSSWEYLFKDYYLELKAKLSLSLDEIAEAKNPWKGADMSGPTKQDSSEAQPDANEGCSGSDNSIENSESVRRKRRKTKKQSKSVSKKAELISTGGGVSMDKASSLSDNSEWASKELLEFVSHMKDGDISILSQFDVQALLLEYIKTNKLRDPRRKSQIICDARLENLFGKPRVGHFEMLKLLESHFLVRDEQIDDFQGTVVDTENSHLDGDLTSESLSKGVKDRKRKARRKSDRGPQSNLDDYAAIDMHNIGLIYLRRKLMEDLLEDAETFHDKVIGTFVRIRISGTNQKQDLYRLVQVVGTSKAPETYKVGKRSTDIMVEILNLDKTENISIDTISNQEFTEEECKRLRQSIKCGLISRLNVGEILDKTMEIQVARVNDWLESETQRLSHLRDRASDLGRRKELRECVEKLQLLKTPEERRRRLEEIPEIHADPKMDPSYESDDNDSENEDTRRDAFMRSRVSGFSRRGRGPISPGSDNAVKDSWSGAGKSTPSRNLSGSNYSINSSHIGEIVNENSWNLESHKETQDSHNLAKQNFASNSEEWSQRNASRPEPLSAVASVPSQGSNLAGPVEPTVKINESEKMWHYQDPSGKVQGPFSMVQLRKWNNTGYFPANLKIWRATEKQENSILLTDALAGKFPKEPPPAEKMVPSTNTLHALAGHSGKISSHQEKERSFIDQNSGSHSVSSGDKWGGNDMTNLPSPTPKQGNPGLLTGAVHSPAVNGLLPSPTAVLPSMGLHSSTPAPVLSSAVQTTAFSPTPNSQQGIMVGPAASVHTQPTVVSEQHMVHMPPVQPAAASQNLSDTQVWGGTVPHPGQPQTYGWAAPNVQSSAGSFPNSGPVAGVQPDVWRPPQSNQMNMQPQATPNPNASWGMGPTADNSPMGMRPQNPNVGWGPMPANPNMSWGNPPPANTNVNWGPPMQNAAGWGPPPANTVGNIPVMVPAINPNPGWVPPPQGWVAPPVQGPAPGNGWGPPSGNTGPPPAVQVPGPGPGPGQGGLNHGWAPWGGDPNQGGGGGGGQFYGPRGGGQGRDSGYGGGRPWNNRQSSFRPRQGKRDTGQNKRDTICPFYGNGGCRKGAQCDMRHA